LNYTRDLRLNPKAGERPSLILPLRQRQGKRILCGVGMTASLENGSMPTRLGKAVAAG
jgi:hypothetical protein